MREVDYPSSLASGNLVNIEIDWSQRNDLEFLTCAGDYENVMLWERIDLSSFPSCDDFHGRWISVPTGTVAIVLGVVGIPNWVMTYLMLRKEKATKFHRLIRNDLTVYDILVRGHRFQAFGCDLKIKRGL